MLSHSEGTDQAADPYRVCYGFTHTIVSLSDHPTITGEWMGEKLPDAMCMAAGFSPGCVSTAAGKYQINLPTWKRCRVALTLRDFSTDSQDRAAAYLIQQDGALNLVNAGQIVDAIGACRKTWASLPGNPAGQPQLAMSSLIRAYSTGGGAFA